MGNVRWGIGSRVLHLSKCTEMWPDRKLAFVASGTCARAGPVVLGQSWICPKQQPEASPELQVTKEGCASAVSPQLTRTSGKDQRIGVGPRHIALSFCHPKEFQKSSRNVDGLRSSPLVSKTSTHAHIRFTRSRKLDQPTPLRVARCDEVWGSFPRDKGQRDRRGCRISSTRQKRDDVHHWWCSCRSPVSAASAVRWTLFAHFGSGRRSTGELLVGLAARLPRRRTLKRRPSKKRILDAVCPFPQVSHYDLMIFPWARLTERRATHVANRSSGALLLGCVAQGSPKRKTLILSRWSEHKRLSWCADSTHEQQRRHSTPVVTADPRDPLTQTHAEAARVDGRCGSLSFRDGVWCWMCTDRDTTVRRTRPHDTTDSRHTHAPHSRSEAWCKVCTPASPTDFL